MHDIYMLGIKYPVALLVQSYIAWIVFFLCVIIIILVRWYVLVHHIYKKSLHKHTSHIQDIKRKHTEKKLWDKIQKASTDSTYIQFVTRYLAFYSTKSYAWPVDIFDVIALSDEEKHNLEEVLYKNASLSDALRIKIQNNIQSLHSTWAI